MAANRGLEPKQSLMVRSGQFEKAEEREHRCCSRTREQFCAAYVLIQFLFVSLPVPAAATAATAAAAAEEEEAAVQAEVEADTAQVALVVAKRQAPELLTADCTVYRYGSLATSLDVVRQFTHTFFIYLL